MGRWTTICGVMLGITLFAGGCATAPSRGQKPRLAVQLWSVKDEVKRDFEGTLTRLATLGFEGVEFAGEFGPYRNDPAGLKAFLARTKLRCASAHVGLDRFSDAHVNATINFYKAAGCTDLIVPADHRAASVTGSAQLARELMALSSRLAPLGMRAGYHNHSEEMAGPDGQTPWDVLAKGTPDAVILQQDVGWTMYAGKDPTAYVRRYPGRSVSLHMKAKLRPGTSGTPIIGKDRTDWAALTQAARESGGTTWLIVEQEEYPEGMGQVDAVAASLAGLQAVLAGHAVK